MRAPIDRIASHESSRPDRLEAAVQRLVAEIPLRSRVLEIGCGTGLLARELASKRGARVTAIDRSQRMIEIARTRTSATLGIEYRVADFMELSPRGFDVIVAVDASHQVPLFAAARRMAAGVVAGGQVLIVDRFDPRGFAELPYNALSWLWGALGAATSEGSDRPGGALPLCEIRAGLREAMPGVRVRRRLGGRYVARWRCPARERS